MSHVIQPYKPYRALTGFLRKGKMPRIQPRIKTLEEAGFGEKAFNMLDYLNRLQYMTGGLITGLQAGKGLGGALGRAWRGLKGEEKWGGEDILRLAGMRKGTGRNIAGFLLSLGIDPLTYLGFGGLTKLGKAARLAKAVPALAKAPKVSRLGRLALKLQAAGKLKPLAATMAGQARLGQRGLVTAGLPFLGRRALVRAPRAFAALGRAGKAVRATRIGGAVRGLFKRTTGIPELDRLLYGKAEPLAAAAGEMGREQALRAATQIRKAARVMPSEITRQFVRPSIRRLREAEPFTGLVGKALKRAKRAVTKRGIRLAPAEAAAAYVRRGVESFPLRKAMRLEKPVTAVGVKLKKRLLAAIQEVRKGTLGLRQMEKSADLPGGFLKDYLPHVFTKGARRLWDIDPRKYARRFLGKKATHRFLLQRLLTSGASIDKFNALAKAGAFGSEWAKLPKVLIDDPVKLLATRSSAAANAVGGSIMQKAAGAFSGGRVLKAFGAGAQEAQTRFLQANPDIGLYALSKRGIVPFTRELGPKSPILEGFRNRLFAIPKRIGDSLAGHWQKITRPDEMEKAISFLGKAYDTAHGRLRIWTLAYFPAYHVRNVVGNLYASFLGGLRNPVWFARAASLQRGKMKGLRIAGKMLSPRRLAREITEYGIASRGWFGVEVPELAGARIRKLLPHTRIGIRVGRAFENNARIGLYLWARNQGMNPIDASLHVKKYLFDYSDLSKFEQRFMKRITFFYTWARKMMGLLLEESVKRPIHISAIEKFRQAAFKAAGEKEEALPEWMRERMPIPFPPLAAKRKAGAIPISLLESWLPPAELRKLGRPVRAGMEMVTPLARLIPELGFGVSAYYQRPLERYPGERRKFLGARLPVKTVHALRTFRILNEIDRFMRVDLPASLRVLMVATGLRTYGANIARERTRREAKAAAKVAMVKRLRAYYAKMGRRDEVEDADRFLERMGTK